MWQIEIKLILTLIAALLGGLTALRLKIPAGAVIGSMFTVAIFNIITGDAFLPQNVRVATQIVAGAFIGLGIKRRDLLGLKLILKPAIILALGMISLNLIIGYIMHKITGIDLITSLFACAPGGLVDMSLISQDMGADTSKVAILQLIRVMSVLMLMPAILKFMCSRFEATEKEDEISKRETAEDVLSEVSKGKIDTKHEYTTKERCINLTLTMICAFLFGGIGYLTRIPAGTMIFSMVSVGILGIYSNKSYMPMNIKRFTQICAGAIIGERMTLADIIGLKAVMFPAIILLIGIIIVNLSLGILISRISKVDLKTSLFASAPGGVSDMALIAGDFGGDAPKVAVLQLVRLVSIICFFPAIIKYIAALL